MRQKFTNFKQYHRVLQLVYMILLQGLLLFMFLVYFQSKDTFFKLDLIDSNIVIGIIVVLAALVISFFLYRFLLIKISDSKGLKNKLEKYTTAFIVKMAILEGGAFFNLVMFLNTANKSFLIFSALLLLAMMMSFPGVDKIEKALGLSKQERLYLQNPDKEFSE